MKASGRLILLVFLTTVAILGGLMRLGLWNSARDRFAVVVRTDPPSDRLLVLGRPLLVRIEKGRAGRSAMPAVALLLSAEGQLLAEPQVLNHGQDERGRRVEETRFAPFSTMPPGNQALAVVLRLPDVGTTALLPYLDEVREGARQNVGPHLLFSAILQRSQKAGGHAEMVVAELRY